MAEAQAMAVERRTNMGRHISIFHQRHIYIPDVAEYGLKRNARIGDETRMNDAGLLRAPAHYKPGGFVTGQSMGLGWSDGFGCIDHLGIQSIECGIIQGQKALA